MRCMCGWRSSGGGGGDSGSSSGGYGAGTRMYAVE